MAGLFRRLTSDVKQKVAGAREPPKENGFVKASEAGALFPPTNPDEDGEDCLHDCDSCTVKYPRKFEIDETDELYGLVKGWSTHLVVATGKADWVRDVADEPGSVMEAVRECGVQPSNGKMMLSASNLPLPDHASSTAEGTTVLLLPAFTYIDNVRPSTVPDLLTTVVSPAPTSTTPPTPYALPTSLPAGLSARPCTHSALILLCSQGTRDARCGQSAPLLKRELERHLRDHGLFRDADDHRPGGVGVVFISHVGGHKYSANVMVYRKGEEGGAGQCIWLARVRPEDCENLVRYTVMQGKVVKPATQLRGGFDRAKGLTSW